MTTTQIDWSPLGAQLSEAADLMRTRVDAEMAEFDLAVRALAQDIHLQAREALAAVEAPRFIGAPRSSLEV